MLCRNLLNTEQSQLNIARNTNYAQLLLRAVNYIAHKRLKELIEVATIRFLRRWECFTYVYGTHAIYHYCQKI